MAMLGNDGEPWTAKGVRETFVDYYSKRHEHTFFGSSPVVPYDDPTLLFANAGMNQFKPIFLGQADPNGPLAPLKRAVNSQKCIRAGGKHNDLDDVGKDTYHHTFFEMLGTWSFGDYFKAETIDWSWELLTDVYGIPPDRLYASYFGGDKELGLDPDYEARDLWLKHLPPDRVLPFGKADNFWEMGETGPCGPCSEIHVDRIGGRDAAALVNMDDPDVVEVWNLVFMQYNREPDGSLRSLPAKHIDTGMGFERLVSILQDRRSNYDTDVFAPILADIEQQLKLPPYAGKLGADDVDLRDTAYRVIADHLRTLSFAIADGALPSNEGRGYVLRRVLRRAVRYGQQILGAEPGFFHKLVPVTVATYAEFFPELAASEDKIVEILADEEQAFSSMLGRGVKYFNELVAEIEAVDGKAKVINGEQAFFLYDTLGFPVDLTEIMAEEVGFAVDKDGFVAQMEAQKDRSRKAAQLAKQAGADGAPLKLEAEETSKLAADGVATTNDEHKYEWDVAPDAVVQAIVTGPREFAAADATITTESGTVGLVLDTTSFYAEAGGQVNDVGTLELPGGAIFAVRDVQVFGGYVLHSGTVVSGELKVGDAATCRVDYDTRRKVAPNHTMTHLLNFALRSVLGDGVSQKGSLCNADKLRFDFSHKKALTLDQVTQVEALIQDTIVRGLPVSNQVVPLAEAKALRGLQSVFGEAYPDPVRVVAVEHGLDAMRADPSNDEWATNSVELCGGTHLTNTAEAQAFALIEESAVAKGVRRVIGVTGDAAITAQRLGSELLAKAEASRARMPDAPMDELQAAVADLRTELEATGSSIPQSTRTQVRTTLEDLQKRVVALNKKQLDAQIARGLETMEGAIAAAVDRGDKYLVLDVPFGTDGKVVKKAVEKTKKIAGDLPVLCFSEDEPGSGGKVLCFAIVPEAPQQAGLAANEWVQAALSPCGGRGGGKKDAAQGQSGESKSLDAARRAAADLAADLLG